MSSTWSAKPARQLNSFTIKQALRSYLVPVFSEDFTAFGMRVVWRVDLLEDTTAETWFPAKRRQLELILKEQPEIVFFLSSVSSVTGIKERPTKKQKLVNKGDFSEPPGWEEEMDKFIGESDNEDFEASPPREPDRDGSFVSDRKNRVYPALTFWVVTNVDYMSVADFETKLRQIMLKAGLDIDHCTPVKSRKKTSTLDAYTATLCQVIKDHKWAYARDLMEKSFYRLSATAVCEYAGVHIDPDNIESQPYLEDLPSTQEFSKRIVRMWITTSCPQLVAAKIRQALTDMRYTDLFYDIVDEESSSAKSAESTESNVLSLHCPSNKTLVAIRYVQRTMHKLNYALYRGHIYKKPSESKFAYVYTTTVESFLNTLLANKKIAEVLINQLQQVSVILSNRECSIIKQIQIDHNLIEVLPTGTCFNIEEKRFVCDPFGESDIGKITPRAFVHYTYKEGVIPHPKRFIDGIENSFGRGTDECKDFLRKYY